MRCYQGEILDELLRESELRDDIIIFAWPSLLVESKLQIINAIQQRGFGGMLSDEIFELAGADSNPVVRFWACRFQQAAEIRSDNKRSETSGNKLNTNLESPSLFEIGFRHKR